jgi:hypothetical protein
MERSHLDGILSIQEIYNDVMMRLKKSKDLNLLDVQSKISGIGIGWAISGGEIRGLKYYNSVSVAGVYDTIRILEDVEAGKLKDIQYLECLICPDGCVGGPLTVENRFVAKSDALRLIRTFGGTKKVDSHFVKKSFKEGFFSFEGTVKPKPFPPLDEDRSEAIKKMKMIEKLVEELPRTDCGVCGAPDCRTFAEDVVRGNARIEECLFVRKHKVKHGKR